MAVASAVPQRQSLKTLIGESESKEKGDIVVRREGCLLFITERFHLWGISGIVFLALARGCTVGKMIRGVFLLNINSSIWLVWTRMLRIVFRY